MICSIGETIYCPVLCIPRLITAFPKQGFGGRVASFPWEFLEPRSQKALGFIQKKRAATKWRLLEN